MIERTIEWCASNRSLVFTGTVVLTLWGMTKTPLTAVPDISDVQVIVATEWMGRSPDLIEDQITYPIVTSLISTAPVKSVRGFTDFGHFLSLHDLPGRDRHVLGALTPRREPVAAQNRF